MRIAIGDTLAQSVAAMWPRVTSTEFILRMSDPYLRYDMRTPNPAPSHFEHGKRYRMIGKLFGFVPTDTQDVESHVAIKSEGQVREIRNVSTGFPLRWDHIIRLTANEDGTTTYLDQIDVEAGLLTPAFGSFIRFIFAQRRKNWKIEFGKP